MIERNLGNLERIVRLILGLCFGGWALTHYPLNGIEWFVTVIALFLVLNGIFSRCYLWYVLDINTARKRECDPTSVC